MKTLHAYLDLLVCVDPSELEVQGDIATEIGQSIAIDIIKCTGSEECRSDEEIKNYFAQRQMYLVSN